MFFLIIYLLLIFIENWANVKCGSGLELDGIVARRRDLHLHLGEAHMQQSRASGVDRNPEF